MAKAPSKHESPPSRGLSATGEGRVQDTPAPGRDALERRIAAILEGTGDDPSVPIAVREIDRVRSGAVAIREAGLSPADEVHLAVRLLQVAKRCQVPWMAVEAIVDELAPDDPPPADPNPTATAARRLARAGFLRCPVCRFRVLDEMTLQWLERAEREWLANQVVVAERRDRVRGLA